MERSVNVNGVRKYYDVMREPFDIDYENKVITTIKISKLDWSLH